MLIRKRSKKPESIYEEKDMGSNKRFICEVKQIRSHSLKKALSKAGLGDIELYKDNGYFFIACDNEDSPYYDIIPNLYRQSIYANNFSDLSIDDWVEEIKCLLEQE